ncbi:hypothetical protein CVT24_012181 [Panaeolus cyanescens]|uniref:Uncharacterized protein n=1 Tax=Panaeolus cyanescens TaxID=181874 RepID=A0A409YIX6_9AGAR|nr:hypothetical protein CVT24_012181 [Panaeolus cyanescens]
MSDAAAKPARKTPAKKLKARREYYARNLEREREKSRERARQKRSSETAEEANIRRARHREAASRYRHANKNVLRIASWQRRQNIKVQKMRQRDQAEYDAWMNEGYTEEQREQREKDRAEIDAWMDEEYPDAEEE